MQQRLRTRGRLAASAGYRYLRLCVLGVGMAAACDSGAPPPAAVGQPPVPKPPGQRLHDATRLAQGKALYEQYCVTCHGQQAVGTPDWRQRDGTGRYPPPPLNGTAHAWHHPRAQLQDIIKQGGPLGKSNMPAFQNQLSDAQIDAIIVWLQSLWSGDIYQAWYDIDQQYRAWANENESR